MVDGCRLALTGKLHDAVGLPGLAAVGRERLFPTAGIRGVDVPDEAVENVPAFEHFLRMEFSARAIELADHWHIHSSRMARAENSDRKSTRLNFSHMSISYAVFCLKKKKKKINKKLKSKNNT